MTDANVCPRTGEVCSWREKCISETESQKRMQRWAEILDKGQRPFQQFFRKVAQTLNIYVLPTSIYEDMAVDFKAKATRLETILEMSCTRDETCIVYEAMVENHIVEPTVIEANGQ